MTNEKLFLDENCFSEISTDIDLAEGITDLLGLFRELGRSDTKTLMCVNSWEIPLPGGRAMYNLLYDEPNYLGLSKQITLELNKYLDRCQVTSSTVVQATITKATIATSHQSAVYTLAEDDHKASNICPIFVDLVSDCSGGSATLSTPNGQTPCFVASTMLDMNAFYRFSMEISLPLGKAFIPAANRAFPNLQFHPGIKIEDIGVDLKLHWKTILLHLTFLNDEFGSIGKLANWDLPKMQQEARARGIDFSDESSNTKNDAKKMRERIRTFEYGGKEHQITCSLHTKILPTEGRIHFHYANSNDPKNVLIGIFDKHLPV